MSSSEFFFSWPHLIWIPDVTKNRWIVIHRWTHWFLVKIGVPVQMIWWPCIKIIPDTEGRCTTQYSMSGSIWVSRVGFNSTKLFWKWQKAFTYSYLFNIWGEKTEILLLFLEEGPPNLFDFRTQNIQYFFNWKKSQIDFDIKIVWV